MTASVSHCRSVRSDAIGVHDFPLLPLKGNFNGRDVKEAMKGHILASTSTVGTYTLNPKLLKNS